MEYGYDSGCLKLRQTISETVVAQLLHIFRDAKWIWSIHEFTHKWFSREKKQTRKHVRPPWLFNVLHFEQESDDTYKYFRHYNTINIYFNTCALIIIKITNTFCYWKQIDLNFWNELMDTILDVQNILFSKNSSFQSIWFLIEIKFCSWSASSRNLHSMHQWFCIWPCSEMILFNPVQTIMKCHEATRFQDAYVLTVTWEYFQYYYWQSERSCLISETNWVCRIYYHEFIYLFKNFPCMAQPIRTIHNQRNSIFHSYLFHFWTECEKGKVYRTVPPDLNHHYYLINTFHSSVPATVVSVINIQWLSIYYSFMSPISSHLCLAKNLDKWIRCSMSFFFNVFPHLMWGLV